mgnify:CR=1 FL=1
MSCGSLFIYFNSHPIKPRILTIYDWVSDAVLRLVLLRPINPNRTNQRVDHEEVNTMEACAAIDELLEPAVICKNLFLTNSAKTEYYLLMLCADKKFRTAEVSKQIGASRLSFADSDKMLEFLDITPGSVSVMGLMNDHEHRVHLIVDEDVFRSEYFGCHPCINTSSLRIKTKDVFEKVLPELGVEYRTVSV